MSDIRIQPATSANAPAVGRVARESRHAAYDSFLGEEVVDKVVDDWYDIDSLRDAAENDDHVFVVAVNEGDIRGFAHAGPAPERDIWNLFRIYVISDYWGNDIGTALLEYVEGELKNRGISTYELAVLGGNDVGISFYESRGFEQFETDETELAGVEANEYWYQKEL